MRITLTIILILTLTLPSCSVAQKSATKKKSTNTETSKLKLDLSNDTVFGKIFTGFALYDPHKGEMLYDYNAGKYFIPASNTKLFTYYTCMNILGDSIPALQYSKQGDFMVIWGTGDPSFLNSKLPQNPAVFDFLKNCREQLFFSGSNFEDRRFGSGWMWSDFGYAYQAEKSPFPVYGNLASFRQDSSSKAVIVQPPYFVGKVIQGLPPDREDIFGRAEFDNTFYHNTIFPKSNYSAVNLPFMYTPSVVAQLLSDTLKRQVQVLDSKYKAPADALVIYSIPADSLYKLMLQESDNFIAEQLLMLCSWKIFGTMNTEKMIDFAEKNFLTNLPDKPQWYDGSGLSRYNLFTPRSMVILLDNIYKMVPKERLFSVLPAGGVSGTIRNQYKSTTTPYVYAKTGTLRYNHSLSGFLVTNKGRVLIFSFMHNNFASNVSNIRSAMEKVLLHIRETM